MPRLFRLAALLAVLLASAAAPHAARAQAADGDGRAHRLLPADPDADLYYLSTDEATLFRSADSLRPIARLARRASLHRLGQEGGWTHVRTDDGREGFLRGAPLSNVWIQVSKSRRTITLYEGTTVRLSVPADFGYNPMADKEQRGSMNDPDHWRTPEGVFYVTRLHPRSQFYRAFVLSYPSTVHARRALDRGLISARDYEAIAEAERTFAEPPMNTAMGGMIEIHGSGTGAGVNWTQGCVAVRNTHMDAMWGYVTVGTPVVIDP